MLRFLGVLQKGASSRVYKNGCSRLGRSSFFAVVLEKNVIIRFQVTFKEFEAILERRFIFH